MTSEDILRIEFDKLREDILARYEALKLRASGRFEKELENKTSGLTGLLIGSHYTEQLVSGRPPGKFPPLKFIEAWIRVKPIRRIAERISVSSLAFLIARKIAREGTEIFKKGGSDLISSVITPERVQSIINKVTEFNVNYALTRS
jgi:hypothetical protein